MKNYARKPLILPQKIVEMLRGERGYTEDSKDFALLALDCYQDGKAGRAYDVPDPVPVESWPVELVERFMRACWEQGRKDAGAVVV